VVTPEILKRWHVKDWILEHDGVRGEGEEDPHLWTEEEFGDFIMIADWRWVNKPTTLTYPIILPDGTIARNEDGSVRRESGPFAGDSGIYLRGNDKSQVNIWCHPIGSGEVYGYRDDKNVSDEVRAGVTPRVKADNPIGEWNRFIITMRGDRLTVVLNGKTVIENAQLPGVPAKGRIALQHHGAPIQFANLFIRRLD